MALATLSIDLVAKLATFEADLGKASRSIDKLAANTRGAFAGIGDSFAGNLLAGAATEAIAQLTNLFPALIEGVGAFQDLSEETGASAVALAGFQTAADVSGVSVETLAGLMVKLTGSLGKITDEGKGAGLALKQLGIPLAEFRALRPDEQITRLAATFEGFADGSTKTAYALALFGKQGAQVLKFFKEYGDGAAASTRFTAEMISQADNWADASARSSSELRQVAQVIAVQMLPALTAIKQGFAEGAAEVLGFKGATAQLDPRLILDFAEAGAIAVATLAEALVGVGRTIRAVGGSFQSVGANMRVVLAGAALANPLALPSTFDARLAEMRASLDNRNKVATEANQRYVDLWNSNGTAVSDALRKSFAEQRRLLDPENVREMNRLREQSAGAATKPTLAPLTLPDKDAAQAADKRDQAFARFMSQVAKQDEMAQAQLDTGGKLAESDRRRIDLLGELTDASKGFTLAQMVDGEAAAAALIAKIKRFEVEQDITKTRAAAQAIEDRGAASRAREIDSLIAGNQALREQIEEIGLSAEQVERLRIARLAHTAALEDEGLVMLRNAGASESEIADAERRITLLRQQIALRTGGADKADSIARDPTKGASDALDAYLKKIAESGTATREAVGQAAGLLENDLTTSLKNGELSVSQFVDFAISEFLRLAVVRPLMTSITGGLSSLFGFADGGAFGPGRPLAFASGGIFDSPTLFKFANGGAMSTGVMGEAEPEAVMPLKRGPGGRLGVEMWGGGGGGVNITQHITIGAGVSRNEVMAAMDHTKRATIAAIADAQRRGRETA